MSKNKAYKIEIKNEEYQQFDQLDGTHPYQTQVPDGFILYDVRKKKGGKVKFFNFSLAKEMGLISNDHSIKMNKQLEDKILDVFSIVIINEYDLMKKKRFPEKEKRKNPYMATKYLQLQHPDKRGKKSGDGRTIWNGIVKNGIKTWDVSSCGTGATSLSPATSLNNKFYQTGDPTVSYGCGLSSVKEGFETLFFSETLAMNSMSTERILAIIEFKKGYAINIRAHENLLRPSHFFAPLKQNNLSQLEDISHYYIQREIGNGKWEKTQFKNKSDKYHYLAKKVAENFSTVAARFEDDYIFCWLDWDGDNILMDGGIIDYGSVRQFGLFHSSYRFDDHDRFSTTILEQKSKARYITQCFIQIADFLSTGQKKALQHFKKHPLLDYFEENFQKNKDVNLLKKLGFNNESIKYLVKHHQNLVRDFRDVYFYFESAKSKRKLYKISDGVTRDAIFCMRDLLRELPQILLVRGRKVSDVEFFEILKSSYASRADLKITKTRKEKTFLFQKYYCELVSLVAAENEDEVNDILLEMMMRSSVINKYDRITGDAISYITQKLFYQRKKIGPKDLYDILQDFIQYQDFDPDRVISQRVLKKNNSLLKSFSLIIQECREGL